ncbi:hypothetical protein AB4450_13060 [Vibrio breoganii]
MRIISTILIITSIAVLGNYIITVMNSVIGSTYGRNQLKQCLNNPRIKEYNHILIGTSVTRELSFPREAVKIDDNMYFNCGISAVSVNLGFHYLILDLLADKIDLSGKKILIELSLQGALDSSSIITSVGGASSGIFDIAPIKTKIFWIEDFFRSDSNFEFEPNLSSMERLKKKLLTLISFIKSIYFPSTGFQYISENNDFVERKNAYKDVTSDKENINSNQVGFFTKDFKKDINKFRIDKITELVKKQGAELKFMIPPVNTLYSSYTGSKDIIEFNEFLIDEDIFHQAPIVMNSLDSIEYFADCCHLNNYGRKKLTKKEEVK